MEFIKFNSSLYKLQQHQELQKRYWLMHKRRIVVLSLSIYMQIERVGVMEDQLFFYFIFTKEQKAPSQCFNTVKLRKPWPHKLVYVVRLHAVQFGNNWLKEIPRTAKIGWGRKPSPISLLDKFFYPIIFKFDEDVVLVLINYIAGWLIHLLACHRIILHNRTVRWDKYTARFLKKVHSYSAN